MISKLDDVMVKYKEAEERRNSAVSNKSMNKSILSIVSQT